jgi:WD40 repeat protein
LNAFDERDAAFFFGREAATTAVLDRMSHRLDGSGLLVVSGVSGAGKSSLLRAGVLPRLRREGLAAAPESAAWPCLVFTPGPAPLDELALRVALLARTDAAAVRRTLEADPAGFALTARQAALAQGGVSTPDGQAMRSRVHRLLLVVDQFEQLFTQCPDEEQRRAFLTALHAAAGRAGTDTPAALVVLSVRADFEAHCAEYAQLADAIQDRYLVTSMTDRQLRMAITEPAKQAGSRVEDNLVETLLREISTRGPLSSSAFPASRPISGAGVLPLVSHALDQAWRNRAGDTVALPDYERTGGIEEAVADSAQRAYDGLTSAQQSAARQVFIRLTATTADGVDIADRVARTELIDGKRAAEAQDVVAVLEAFAAERLLTLAASTVEISHEVLLTAWPLLRDTWLAESRADRIVRTRLHSAAAEWTRDSRDPSYLYSGSLLEAATDTAARASANPVRYPPLSESERDFLQASDRARRRRVRRRRTFTASLMALVVCFAAAAVLALQASRNAAQQRDDAVARQLIAQSEAVGDSNPAIAKLDSIAAWRIHPSDDARYAMLAAATRPGIATLTGHTAVVHSVAFNRDGKMLVSGGDDGTVRLWDVARRQPIGDPLTGTGYLNIVYSVAFSPNGKTVASGGDDGSVRLWDVARRRQLGDPLTGTGYTRGVYSVAFSPDGKILVSGGDDGTVRLWDVASRRQLGDPLTGTGYLNIVYSVAFSPNGKTVASGSEDGTVRLWDVATRRQLGVPLTGHARAVNSVVFSPDGKTVASGGEDGTVRLWDLASRRQLGDPLTGHTAWVPSVAFSPHGKMLAGSGADGTVRVWDVATHRQIGDPLTGNATSVAFSPDGRMLVIGGVDGAVRLWDAPSRQQIGTPLTGHIDAISSVAFSTDGKTLVSGSFDGTVRVWDVATHRRIGDPLKGSAMVALSRDGKTLASGGSDGTVRLWDVATHRQIGDPLTGSAASVAFSPDGKRLVSGGGDGTVRLWDVSTRHQIGTPLEGHTNIVSSVGFSADGTTLASSDDDGTVRLWDVATHRQIGDPLTGSATSVALSPDGKMLVSGGGDGTVRLWDVATHRQIGDPLTGSATSVRFSPDGKTLVSGGIDGTVRLWDVATHRQIGTPLTAANSAPVLSVGFSPDGKTLVSGGYDRSLRLWDVAYLVNIVPRLCASIGRSFTPAEWRKYVPPGPSYRILCP